MSNMEHGLTPLRKTLNWSVAAQREHVARWHGAEPEGPPLQAVGEGLEAETGACSLETLQGLVLAEHLVNFRLWHVEDEARRRDVDAEVIADCKRRIDALNQQRNDIIERVDGCLVALIEPHLPPAQGAPRHNTETLGNALDRLSILSLKLFHMAEQAEREDADQALREECGRKLAVLEAQHQDLSRAALELLDDYAAGRKRPRVYRQFKMYNDPRLNPALYGRQGK
jgi:hypothetical protein